MGFYLGVKDCGGLHCPPLPPLEPLSPGGLLLGGCVHVRLAPTGTTCTGPGSDSSPIPPLPPPPQAVPQAPAPGANHRGPARQGALGWDGGWKVGGEPAGLASGCVRVRPRVHPWWSHHLAATRLLPRCALPRLQRWVRALLLLLLLQALYKLAHAHPPLQPCPPAAPAAAGPLLQATQGCAQVMMAVLSWRRRGCAGFGMLREAGVQVEQGRWKREGGEGEGRGR